VDVGAVVRRLLGGRGNLRRIRFHEGKRFIEWYVPDDSLWIAVKDNLVLREYEHLGIDLGQVYATVIDAGAHVGLFALRAAVNARKVIALEPHPELHGLLRMNILGNGFDNIEAVPKALWVDGKEIDLIEHSHSAEASVFGKGGRAFHVETTTLDAVVRDAGRVDLLKLDIEGAEFEVLCGCSQETLAQIDRIVAELHLAGRASRLPDLVRRLQSCGFQVGVREQPVHYWGESISRALRSWQDVESLTALKLAVLIVYSLVALGRIVSLPVEPDASKLKFLYAVRIHS
jgi:FkbM family methyltransferase